MEDRLTTVATFPSVAGADRAASLLRGHGIESFIKDEYVHSWGFLLSPALGGVELQVRESDAAEAAEILKRASP